MNLLTNINVVCDVSLVAWQKVFYPMEDLVAFTCRNFFRICQPILGPTNLV